MSDEKETEYDDPNIAINRVYTRKGDDGETKLVGGAEVPKDSPRIEAYGTVDELNAVLGMARQALKDDSTNSINFKPLSDTLLRVQHELFNLGSLLATKNEDYRESMPQVSQADIDQLEDEIEGYNEDLPELRSFVLPGGSEPSARFHLARTICRRAERKTVELSRREPINETSIAYLNRLGDALFVWGRWTAKQSEGDEVLWDPNVGSKEQS